MFVTSHRVVQFIFAGSVLVGACLRRAGTPTLEIR